VTNKCDTPWYLYIQGRNGMHGTFVWNELATSDVEKAKAFYAEAPGWEFEEFVLPDGTYRAAKSNGKIVGRGSVLRDSA
jgi:predicted enzyme related to lactoylglutathione lyase